MQEADFAEIRGKIIVGVFALTTRTFILQIITFTGTVILGVLLNSFDFGVFFIVSAVISFLQYFSDIGFAGALIQQKEEPDKKEYMTAFTVQEVLVVSIVIIVFIAGPSIASFYHLDSSAIFLLRALLISFFLSSLKTIPSVMLERKLEFKLLAIPQILETAVFYIVVVVLAYLKIGVASFAWAALARGMVGLVSIYYLSPWGIGLGISRKDFRRLFSFGMPYQIYTIMALIKDDLMTLFLGRLLMSVPSSLMPPQAGCLNAANICALGYIGWAKKWAEVPLRLIMDSVMRVTFPAFSRLQEHKDMLGKAIGKSLFFLAFFIFPSTVLLILFIQPLIKIIPRYGKWEPAVISFYLFSISSVMAAFSSPIVNALNALRKINISMMLMMMWTVLTWILVPVVTLIYGYNGVALSALMISSTSFLPILILKRFLSFSTVSSIKKPLIASLIMALPVYLMLSLSSGLAMVILSLVLAVILYGLLSLLFMKKEILPYLPLNIRLKFNWLLPVES